MKQLHKICLRCGRKLKTENSKLIGFGPTCWQKHLNEEQSKKLFEVGAK